MPHRTFFAFILAPLLAMILFIAMPIISVVLQSFHIEHEQVIVQTESCGPFGCTQSTVIDTAATERLQQDQPLGRFVGFDNYLDRGHLAVDEVKHAWMTSKSFGAFADELMNLPFYNALTFTLVYTFTVTPLVLTLGFAIALGVNNLPKAMRGPTIFGSLLPMMVTPLVGSLVLFWMIDAQGVIGKNLQLLFDDSDLSLKASATLTWATLIIYGVWNSAPFAFIVYYAGLQTVPQETIEAAMIDGANPWERVRYVVLPHLAPLTVFIMLIQLMDNFRVFEPIVGFAAEAHATSLSYIIYTDLRSQITRFNSAATTSVLTILGVAVLLTPVLIRTWRDFNRKRV